MILWILALAGNVMTTWSIRNQARKAGKNVRSAILPYALNVVIIALLLGRYLLGDNVPIWVDLVFVIPVSALIIAMLGMSFVRGKRYLQDAWRLDNEKH